MPSTVDKATKYNFANLSWEECEAMAKPLAQRFEALGFTHMLVVARGGLAVASLMLKHMQMKPVIQVVQCSSYEGETRKQLKVESWGPIGQLTNLPKDTTHVGIVDDIWDSGVTMRTLLECFTCNAEAFALVQRASYDRRDPACHHFGGLCIGETWVNFPWEKHDG